ncbi:inositol monophosphatase [bacterium]|nr:inositol monophosphatase [bacterium]
MERIEFAKIVARAAGAILKEGYYSVKKIKHKAGKELVTQYDIASEDIIKEMIMLRFPKDTIIAEETESTSRIGEHVWIVDPLDGTNNFAHGFPFFCVSIGIANRGTVVAGVVYDPLRDEMFWADKNSAYLGNVRLHTSETDDISSALLATGFPYDIQASEEDNLNHFAHFSKAALGIRRAGSAALDLAYVAAGRLDGFWELKLKMWDMAAGSVIVEMAGGQTTTFTGEKWSITSDRIVASNGKIHKAMLKIIQGGL